MSEMPRVGSVWMEGRDPRIGRTVFEVGKKIVWHIVSHGIHGQRRLTSTPEEWRAWVDRTGALEVRDA